MTLHSVLRKRRSLICLTFWICLFLFMFASVQIDMVKEITINKYCRNDFYLSTSLMDTHQGGRTKGLMEQDRRSIVCVFLGYYLDSSPKIRNISHMTDAKTNETMTNFRQTYTTQRYISINNTESLMDGHVKTQLLDQPNNDTRKIKIAILIPSCTRTIRHKNLERLSLSKLSLPTLYKTLENNYTYRIYIGIDKGDYLESVQDRIKNMYQNITIVVIPGPVHTLTKSVNVIARKAYEEGMEYFARINDDTTLETQGWTSYGIDALRRYKPPNVGVVGPRCSQNSRILTHDMVHRTHIRIFGYYYPPYFENWYNDDWITYVYKPNRSTELSTWTVGHHMNFHGSRYNVNYTKHAQLKMIIAKDKERLNSFIQKLSE